MEPLFEEEAIGVAGDCVRPSLVEVDEERDAAEISQLVDATAVTVVSGHMLQVCTSAFFKMRGTGEFGFMLMTGAVMLEIVSLAVDSAVLQLNETVN